MRRIRLDLLHRPTRRALLGGGLAAAGALAAPRTAAADVPPLTKADVGYQDVPRNGEACGTCVYFVLAKVSDPQGYGRCRMVAGRIVGGGWCEVWAPNSKAVAGSD